MLQNITPHAAESNFGLSYKDELDLLGAIYFESLLRLPALRSVCLSSVIEWGEALNPSDQRLFIPLNFLGEIVGSIELRLDPSISSDEVSKIKSRVDFECVSQIAAFFGWKQPTTFKRAQALRTLFDLKKKYSDFDWIGIYRLDTEKNDLVLGAYIGEASEHVRIPIDQGICGAAVRENDTINVPDVLSDPRFIACSVKTRSELVVPIRNSKGQPIAEIDIDSNRPAAFTSEKVAAVQAAAFKLATVLGA